MSVNIVGNGPAFFDVCDLLKVSIEDLGYEVTVEDAPRMDAVNILLAYQFQPVPAAGCKYIVYQLEQLPAVYERCIGPLKALYRGALAVLDYDPANIEFAKKHGVTSSLIPMGYHPKLDRISKDIDKDVDVLFYGWVNHRRQRHLDQLSDKCRLKVLTNSYREERDEWIARSKVVLNLHHYPTRILEQTRVAYLLNNGACVVSEVSEWEPWPLVTSDDVAEVALSLLDDNARQAVTENTVQAFRRQKMVDTLKQVVGVFG